MPNSPVLLLVDWPNAITLIGAGPEGKLYASPDGGGTWSTKGAVPGTPGALTASGPADVYIATDTGIHTSHDGGLAFPVSRPLN